MQDKQVIEELDNTIVGKWVRIGQTRPIKENGLIEGDFGNDQTIDIVESMF